MIYVYQCSECNQSFEVKKPIADVLRPEYCSQCGTMALRKYTPLPFSVGWRLSDRSHERFGPKDEYERDV